MSNRFPRRFPYRFPWRFPCRFPWRFPRISALGALALAVGWALAWPGPAAAIALNKCALIQHSAVGVDTLVNRCNVCMVIKVERSRPSSNTVPTLRDYTLPAGSAQPLPFKGPGGTRVINEYPCAGPPQPAQ